MHFRRNVRRWLSGWLLFSILFTQIATAAYACPLNKVRAAAQSEAMEGMPCAEVMAQGSMMDVAQPGLCQQHCQFGNTQQPADPWQSLQAPAAAPVLLFVLSPAVDPGEAGPGWSEQLRRRDRAPPPSHSILHCCFRL